MNSEISDNRGMKIVIKTSAIIVLTILLLGGINYFFKREIKVVKATYENGGPKEVWILKGRIIGQKNKIQELTYFKNGNKQSEVDYQNDEVNGWARMWFESGKLHVEATYKDSKTHGVRNAYHENGKVFCRAEYENGKLLRKQNWDENGKEIFLPLDRD